MIDYSYNATIFKNKDISIGKNILTSITDQGILRIFFTDDDGNLYGSIVKRSNFKQIVNNSSDKRGNMNNTNMSQQYYGAPFLTKKYRNLNMNTGISQEIQGNIHIGTFNINWRHDAFLDNRRGNNENNGLRSSDNGININGAGYDSKGYSTGADIWYDKDGNGTGFGISGEVPSVLKNDVYQHFKDQRIPNTFWDCVGEGFFFEKNGENGTLHNFRINSSDVYRFINAEENLPHSISGCSETLSPNDINSRPTLDYEYPHIRTTSSSAVRKINTKHNSYFQVCRRPSRRMIIQDMGGNTLNEEGNATKYPQGFILYADDTELKIRALFENTKQNYSDIKWRNSIATVDPDSAYCDLVLDISRDVVNNFKLYENYGPSGDTMINYNDTLSRAFFIYEFLNDDLAELNIGSLTPINYNVHLDQGGNVYDYSWNLIPSINISGKSYCKIKCDKNTGWDSKKIHIVYKENEKRIKYERYNISGFMEPNGNTGSINGIASQEISYNIDCSKCGWCSMDLDKWNNPHIAFFDICGSDLNGRINYTWNDYSGNKDNWKYPTGRSAYIINNNVDNYFDLSSNRNENFLSLACSQYDGSVHISYTQQANDIQYWTNSQYTPHAIKDPSNKTVFSALAYGKKLVDDKIRNPYVDLSWNMDISNIYQPLYSIDTPYPYITSPKRKVEPKHSKYDSSQQLNANLCDIIYINTTVQTPTTFDVSKTIFLMGGDTGSEGAYIGGVRNDGRVYFGINGINNTLSTGKELSGNEIYQLTFYYNKYDREAKITISGGKNDAGGIIYDNSSELFTNIPENGVYNMLDGYLTIGSNSHENDNNGANDNNWTNTNKNGFIKRISVYNTDISNIVFYDILRGNSNIITDWPHTQYIDYSGHLVSNKKLNTREKYSYSISGRNEYNKIQKKKSINTYTKELELHELFNIQRIKQQPSHDNGIEITARSMDVYKKTETRHDSTIWVVGEKKEETEDGINSITGYILVSNDGGQSWVENKKHPLYKNIIRINLDLSHNKTDAQYYSVKLFTDENDNKWAWLAGNNYGLYYCVADNWNELGTKKNDWKILGDPSGINIRIDNSISKRTLNYVYPVKCNDNNSKGIFGSPPSNDDFHVWIGGTHNENQNDKKNGAFDMVLRGNKDKFNTLTDSQTGISGNIYETNSWSSDPTYPDVCKNIIWADISNYTETALYNINFDNNGISGIIGGKNNIFVTKDGGGNWESRLDSSMNAAEVIGSSVEIKPDGSALFSVVTNSVPWLGNSDNNKDFPVVSTASFDDKIFNFTNGYPNMNGTWNPSYNKGGYWDVKAPPYVRTTINKNPIPKNVYKTNYFKDILNNWVIGYNNNNNNYTIFNKNTNTDTWMRHDLNMPTDIKGKIQSMVAIDNSGVLLFVEGGGSNGGIYKLSVEPPIPNIDLEWPMVIQASDNQIAEKTDHFRAKITFKDFENIDISNNFKYILEIEETSGDSLFYNQTFNPNKPTMDNSLTPNSDLGPGFHTDGIGNTYRRWQSKLI